MWSLLWHWWRHSSSYRPSTRLRPCARPRSKNWWLWLPRHWSARLEFRPCRRNGAAASLIAAAESPEIAAVISDSSFLSGKDASEDIGRHYLHDSRTNFWVRALFLTWSIPGTARAIALTYYLRSGIYLGPELLSVIPSASRITIPVLVISGGQDWIVPTDKARQILSAIPRKELLVIPNAAHDTAYSTAPTLYASAVLSFLERSIKSNISVP